MEITEIISNKGIRVKLSSNLDPRTLHCTIQASFHGGLHSVYEDKNE